MVVGVGCEPLRLTQTLAGAGWARAHAATACRRLRRRSATPSARAWAERPPVAGSHGSEPRGAPPKVIPPFRAPRHAAALAVESEDRSAAGAGTLPPHKRSRRRRAYWRPDEENGKESSGADHRGRDVGRGLGGGGSVGCCGGVFTAEGTDAGRGVSWVPSARDVLSAWPGGGPNVGTQAVDVRRRAGPGLGLLVPSGGVPVRVAQPWHRRRPSSGSAAPTATES